MAQDQQENGSELEGLDFGYHWIWTYGHLFPAAGFSAAGFGLGYAGAPGWVVVAAGVPALWSMAGFFVMHFVVRMDELGQLPSAAFAPGDSRVLDLGCGAGRTSVMVALERSQGRVVALDNFSADYIEGHGEAKTRANLLAAGVDDRVEIRSGDMRKIPFPDASFDGVVSSAAIDHLDVADIRATLAEANRVLRSEGQLLLWLIVPNLWTVIAFGPLMYFHNASRGDWREMLDTAGFQIDAEGTTSGLAWMLGTRAGKPLVVSGAAAPGRRAIPRHVLWLSGALVAGGVATQLLGQGVPGLLWVAAAGGVAIHLGAAFFGLTALQRWHRRRRERRNAA